MIFPYYFLDDKLDVTKFSKPAMHYIGIMREIGFYLFLHNYKITVEISGVDNSTEHIATVSFFDIWRDELYEMKKEQAIFPLLDNRFKENSDVKAIFTVLGDYHGRFVSSSVKETVDKLCSLLKLLYKIDRLKAFI